MQDRWRKGGKQREKASGGEYYMAVTLLRCGSEWEWLSTHYSSDLGGQLEESSINQTVAQAEADDSRQQCSKQPPHPTHQHHHQHALQPSAHTHIYLPPHLCAFFLCLPIFYVSLFLLFCCSFSFFLSLSISLLPPLLYALNPLWIPSYKQ